MPSKEHENILIFGKGRVNYYPIRIPRTELSLKRDPGGIERKKINKVWATKPSHLTGIIKLPSQRACDTDGMRNPRSVVKFKKEPLKQQGLAPTQKPVALIEYLIKTYTQEGELILDNTAGSGTLAIAAINTNRNYICIEKDPHYFEVMRNRIANHDPFAPVKTKKPKAAPKGQLTLFDGGLAV
jgi:site-specific DNA-methyltransferase (adenine-specific)